MADTTGTSTNINFTKCESIISEWGTAATAFTGNVMKAADDATLKDLSAAGLESGFIASYDERFKTLSDNLTSISSELSNVIKAFYEVDGGEDGSDDTGTPTYGGGTDTGGSSGGNNGGNNGGGDDEGTPEATPTATATATPTEEEEDHDKVYNNQIKEYEKMSMENLDGLAAELVKYAASQGISVDELLSNEKYAAKVHSLLLQSPNLSDSLKAIITSSSTAVTQEVLKDIFNGKFPEIVGINNDTSSLYLSYLQAIANANGIDVQELCTDSKYEYLLKQAFTDFGKVSGVFNGLNDEDVVKRAMQIYDGYDVEKVDSEAVMVIRTYMDVKAEELGKDVQEFTKEDAKLFTDLAKFGSFATVAAASGTDAIQEALINIAEAKTTPGTSSTTSGSNNNNNSSSSNKAETKNGKDANIEKELEAEEEQQKKEESQEPTPVAETPTTTETQTQQQNTANTQTKANPTQEEQQEIYHEVINELENMPAPDPTPETSNVVGEDTYNQEGNVESSEYIDFYDQDGTVTDTSKLDFSDILNDIHANDEPAVSSTEPATSGNASTSVESSTGTEQTEPADPVVDTQPAAEPETTEFTDVFDSPVESTLSATIPAPAAEVSEQAFEEILEDIKNSQGGNV